MDKRQNNLYAKVVFNTAFGLGILALTTGLLSGCESDKGDDIAKIQKEVSENLRLSDEEIASAIRYSFWGDNGVTADGLQVIVSDGVATLEGAVDNLREEYRAVEICRNIKGVRSVIDRIEVIPIKVSDARLQNDVQHTLLTNLASGASRVRASVKDGEVTLSGTVGSGAERQFVEFELYSLRGVKNIRNQLDIETVKAPRSEREIKNDVERRLTSDLLVNKGAVQVRVDGMEVKLSGKVASAAERERAADDAWIAGVAKVDDSELVVEPWQYDPFRRPGDDVAPDTDSEVENAIKDAFLYDPRVLSPELRVTVFDGMATLSGTVDSLAAKIAAAEDARNTVGILRIHNRVVVKSEDKLDSNELAKRVDDAIHRDSFLTPGDVHAAVDGRTVFLLGNVNTRLEKRHATDVLARVQGVTDLKNLLRVQANGKHKMS